MNNSLAEVHPELITEWSEKNLPLTPDDITFGSNKKGKRLNFRHGYKNPRPHFCNRSTLIIHI